MKKILFLIGISLILSPLAMHTKVWKQKAREKTETKKIPIVYHQKYDVSFFGIEKLHPFDSCKYSKIHKALTRLGIHPGQFYKPQEVTRSDLESVHTARYLDSLNDSTTVARIAEIYPLKFIPNWLLQRYLLRPMRLATGGTIRATELALDNGWAINLSGGYHHAETDHGGGFCFYGDIQLAAKKILDNHPDWKVLIIDLDAHQGNGHEEGCKDDDRIKTFDMYRKNYPHGRNQKHITYPVVFESEWHLGPRVPSDTEYLNKLKEKLPEIIKNEQPNFIIYNAGTDIYKEDPLGRMDISEDAIIERDDYVFEQAKQHDIPITMVLSGGYTSASARIIAHSIECLLRKRNIIH
ncbi:MAG: histone deacetylase [Candidatus Dependentiae bacterium]